MKSVRASGVINSIVPQKELVRVSLLMFSIAKPKSATFMWPSEARRMSLACRNSRTRHSSAA